MPHHDCDIVLSTQADIDHGGHKEYKSHMTDKGHKRQVSLMRRQVRKVFSTKMRLNYTKKKEKTHEYS